MPNELVATLKGEGSGAASEWLVIHADNPDFLSGALDAVVAGLGEKVALAGVSFRKVTAEHGSQKPVPAAAQQVVNGTTQAPWPTPAENAPAAAPVWGQPAQPVPAAQPAVATPAAPAAAPQTVAVATQQWSASPQPQAAPQWNPQPPSPLQPGPALKEWVTGAVGPNGRPMGTDGYETNWMVVQPSAVKGGWAAFMSGAPKGYPAQGGPTGPKQEPIWVDRVKKLG